MQRTEAEEERIAIIMINVFYTYIHCKPDLTPFYVGKGTFKRCHNFSRRNIWHKRIVKKYGKKNIQIIIHKKDSEESAFRSEIRLIRLFRSAGVELCNLTDGGEGVSGCKSLVGHKVSMETREKLSKALKGKKKPPRSVEHRKKISVIQKGKKVSEDQKIKQSLAMIGKKASDETKRKMSEAHRGNKYNFGKKATIETRLKMSKSQKNKIPWNKGIKYSERIF